MNNQIDTESIFSEESLEFNSPEDEKEILAVLQSYAYDNKEYYDH